MLKGKWFLDSGGTIVTTAIFSYFILKMKIRRFHFFGCILSLIGILIVGASNLIYASSNSSETDPV
jgi:drug/metabolite transporter (DMT)-like permease